MNNVSKYLDQYNEIITKIEQGEEIKFMLHESGFMVVLHNLVQEYNVSSVSKQVIIKGVLENAIDLMVSYLMPINFQKKDFTLFPNKVKGDLIEVSDEISYSKGDLPIAFLILKTSILLKDKKLFDLGNMMGSVSKYKEDNHEEDLFCDFKNGTIGIALLYQTMYFLTKIDFYIHQATFWYLESKKKFKQNHEFENYEVEAETQKAIQAFENPQNDDWRRLHFLEYEF